MKSLFINLLLCFFIFSVTIKAQKLVPQKFTDQFVEKAYLFTDRSSYLAGEDIWFKAFLVDAANNTPTDHSNCLYVELINPRFAILKRIVVKLENGLGNGDFQLKDSLPTGTYQIRAYTQWMKNFGDAFFFTKNISIKNTSGVTDFQNVRSSYGANSITFFPESGSLLENVPNTVAFKAINENGLGIPIKGTLLSEGGDSITSFESYHLGMGSFTFTPKPGIQYHATGIYPDGTKYYKEIPKAEKEGYILKAIDQDSSRIKVIIHTNELTLKKYGNCDLIMTIYSRQLLDIAGKVKIDGPVTNLYFSKNKIPTGLCRITLMDTLSRPLNERLLFIAENNTPKLNISTDKTTYAPRQSATIKIHLCDSINKPAFTSLGISVVDKLYEDSGSDSNIASYLLSESEIKGNIEQPGWYFESGSDQRKKALELLLLTQGWRDFIWKQLPDSMITMKYAPEKGITISGRLRKLMVNKPIEEANIYMILFENTSSQLYHTTTDKAGRYRFDGIDFKGSKPLMVNGKGKKNDDKGLIELDSLFNNVSSVKKFWIFKSEETTAIDPQVLNRNKTLKKYKLGDTIALNEVVLKRFVEKPDKYFYTNIYGSPDQAIEITDKMTAYSSVLEAIQGKTLGIQIKGNFPNFLFMFRGPSSINAEGRPLFLLDGNQVDMDIINCIPTSFVDRVDLIFDAKASIYGARAANGVINVLLKKGYEANGRELKIYHTLNQKVNGFYEARTFYSPNYTVKQEYDKPDYRSTIFWNPNVLLDEHGDASVTFYNADSDNEVSIKVEGITETGNPLVGKATYFVTK